MWENILKFPSYEREVDVGLLSAVFHITQPLQETFQSIPKIYIILSLRNSELFCIYDFIQYSTFLKIIYVCAKIKYWKDQKASFGLIF